MNSAMALRLTGRPLTCMMPPIITSCTVVRIGKSASGIGSSATAVQRAEQAPVIFRAAASLVSWSGDLRAASISPSSSSRSAFYMVQHRPAQILRQHDGEFFEER